MATGESVMLCCYISFSSMLEHLYCVCTTEKWRSFVEADEHNSNFVRQFDTSPMNLIYIHQ
jgi:hypothetical protein